jgi:hypothetical protein
MVRKTQFFMRCYFMRWVSAVKVSRLHKWPRCIAPARTAQQTSLNLLRVLS